MKEAFLVKYQGRIALFAPLKGLLMEVRADEEEKVMATINRPQFSFGDLIEMFPEIEESHLLSRKAESQGVINGEKGFSPNAAVLFTTFDCPLRCLYCYAKGGERKVNMSQTVAKAAIDFVIDNTRATNRNECFLHFHGGGEPTKNWQIFRFALDYFQKEAKENCFSPKISLATNGMLSEKQIDWIAARIEAVQISLDGPEEIQNLQRPTAGGKGSFHVVSNTIRSLLKKKIQVIIHSVVTEKGIAKIPEIVRFLASNFPHTTIHLEPACECGRGLITGQHFPSVDLFVDGFIEAETVARSFGAQLFYSGAGPRLAEYHRVFCGVSSPNFVVTPTGLVTACHEAAELEHPLAHHFVYGYFDNQEQRFVFDYQKIQKLRMSCGAEADSICSECFARFYCAGDCLAKNLSGRDEKDTAFLNPRCLVNRGLMKHYIFSQL